MTDRTNTSAPPSGLRRALPFLQWLPTYKKSWLSRDVVAALTVWALIVPEAMAYAGIAGIPVQFGLYAVPLALVGYALFGSCRELIIGPSASVASLSAVTVGGIALATSDGNAYIALTAALAVTVGLLYIIGGLLRFGFIANFFARPVLDGFILGLGLYIAIGQVPKLVGIEKPEGHSIAVLGRTLSEVKSWDVVTFAVGVTALLLLFGLKKIAPHLPAAIIVVALSLAAVPLLDLTSHGVEVVGKVPTGFNFVSVSGVSWTDLISLVPGALAIVVVGFAQSVAIAQSYSLEHHYKIDPNQEMIAYGVANLGAGALQGYTVTGSLSKSAAAQGARSRTPITSVVTALLVLLTVIFLAGLFENLPEAVLGAVVIEAVSGMIKYDKIHALYRARTVELWAALGTLTGVLFIDILPGVIIGVALSFGLLIHALDNPRVSRLGLSSDGSGYLDADVNEGTTSVPEVVIARFESPLVFTNAELFKSEMLRLVHEAAPPPQALVIDFQSVTQLDLTGADALLQLHETLTGEDVRLVLARPDSTVRGAMERADVLETIKTDDMFPTVRAAVEAVGFTPNQHQFAHNERDDDGATAPGS